jgi:uncharacterized membrane protein YphA (DoxX/SURF4 family)
VTLVTRGALLIVNGSGNLKKIPKFIAWLIIVGQSFGSIAPVAGFLGRIAAGGLFIIFTGALIVSFARWIDNELVWRKERGRG